MIKICGFKDRNKFIVFYFKFLNVIFISEIIRLNE